MRVSCSRLYVLKRVTAPGCPFSLQVGPVHLDRPGNAISGKIRIVRRDNPSVDGNYQLRGGARETPGTERNENGTDRDQASPRNHRHVGRKANCELTPHE